MVPTAVSQMIEQIGKVIVSLPLAAIGMRTGMADGAAGALLGITLVEAAALAYMIILYYRHEKKKPAAAPAVPAAAAPVSQKRLARQLISISIPITVSACIIPLAQFVDSALMVNRMVASGLTRDAATSLYGIFSGMVIRLINIPTALALAISMSLVPAISAVKAVGDQAGIRSQSHVGIRYSFLIGFPCSIGMSVLARPVFGFLYLESLKPDQFQTGWELLTVSSLTIVLFTVVQATSGILQGLGKQRIPMYTLVLGVALKIALNYTLVRIPGVDIHGAPWASLLCYTASMIPNLYFVSKYTGYSFNVVNVLVKPFFCAAVMGGAVYGIWTLGFGYPGHLNGFRLTAGILLCVAVGALIYGFLALKTKAIDKNDLPAKIRRFIK
jgi:stage V sporulation protein B